MEILISMLKPWTIAAIAFGPFAWQFVKAGIMRWITGKDSEVPKRVAAIGQVASMAAVVVIYGMREHAPAIEILAQVAIGVIVGEWNYKNVVEPMANSSVPIVPQTATKKHAKEERSV